MHEITRPAFRPEQACGQINELRTVTTEVVAVARERLVIRPVLNPFNYVNIAPELRKIRSRLQRRSTILLAEICLFVGGCIRERLVAVHHLSTFAGGHSDLAREETPG